ncbi:MAG TPA: class I SAM-dependent methyltransferase [Bryobacteraceae bacterium]|nr:class I SAM-dependent methyltransferase [Bryobacteraceae bacterium]
MDHTTAALIRCAVCKGTLILVEGTATGEPVRFDCDDCGGRYARLPSGVYDFTPAWPSFLKHHSTWNAGQNDYLRCARKLAYADDYEAYLREIDSVREVYTSAFSLLGTILDVGGGQGRLRHFLPPNSTYVSLDPWAEAFEHLENQPNLLRAYPCLQLPCTFLVGRAEYLPFVTRSVDWVHMRSVIDHFDDPYIALCEARRVLKPGGSLLVGVSISAVNGAGKPMMVSRALKKLRDDGVAGALSAAGRHITGSSERDHHIWHPSLRELTTLLESVGLEIRKTYRQKRPYDHCVYVQAVRPVFRGTALS